VTPVLERGDVVLFHAAGRNDSAAMKASVVFAYRGESLEGEATLRFDGDAPLLQLEPGIYVHIAAHVRHRVEWTAPDRPTIWLAVFFRGT
jgi:ectoine hydroxylase-related dioxygenase (phytanoyl-CoA dioxygenase family)